MKQFAVARLVSLGLLFAVGSVTETWAVLKTPPVQLIVTPPPCQTDDATYNFQVIMDDFRVVRGIPQLRLVINIQRLPQGRTTTSRDVVQFNSIILVVMQDASSARVKADGQEFVLEANYPDPFDKTGEPRPVQTTFAEMFTGGKVGLTVRTAN